MPSYHSVVVDHDPGVDIEDDHGHDGNIAKPWLTYQSITRPSNGLLLSSVAALRLRFSCIISSVIMKFSRTFVWSSMTDSLRGDEVRDAAVQHVDEDGGQHQRQAVDDVRKLKWRQMYKLQSVSKCWTHREYEIKSDHHLPLQKCGDYQERVNSKNQKIL